MKTLNKLLLSCCLVFSAMAMQSIAPVEAMAQTSSGEAIMTSTATHVATDTANNTTIKTQRVWRDGMALNSATSFQVRLTSISGTPGGVIRLKASNDGIEFKRILPTDSLVVDANQRGKIFSVVGAVYKHYMIEWTPTGTHSTKMNSVAVFRRNKE